MSKCLINYKLWVFTIGSICIGIIIGLTLGSSKIQKCLRNYTTGDKTNMHVEAIHWPQFHADSLLVLFTFGQSNAANYGQEKYNPKNEVYQYYNNQFFVANDPLLGANNVRGSVWGRLGDLLIENGYANRVLIVPVAMGESSASQWAEGGEYNHRITQTLQELKQQGITVNLILCHQGESDNMHNTPGATYIKRYRSILDSFENQEISAPFFLAIASYYPGVNSLSKKQLGCDTAIQSAQQQIIIEHPNVYAGPNTDMLNQAYHRYDGVHFSALGLEEHAKLWLKQIEASGLLIEN